MLGLGSSSTRDLTLRSSKPFAARGWVKLPSILQCAARKHSLTFRSIDDNLEAHSSNPTNSPARALTATLALSAMLGLAALAPTGAAGSAERGFRRKLLRPTSSAISPHGETDGDDECDQRESGRSIAALSPL